VAKQLNLTDDQLRLLGLVLEAVDELDASSQSLSDALHTELDDEDQARDDLEALSRAVSEALGA